MALMMFDSKDVDSAFCYNMLEHYYIYTISIFQFVIMSCNLQSYVMQIKSCIMFA